MRRLSLPDDRPVFHVKPLPPIRAADRRRPTVDGQTGFLAPCGIAIAMRGGGGFRYCGARRRRTSGPMPAWGLRRLPGCSLMNPRRSHGRRPARRPRPSRARRRFHALAGLWLRSRLGGDKILVRVLALLAQLRQLHRAEVGAQRGASALLPLGDRPAGRRIERARDGPLIEIEGDQAQLDLLLLGGRQVERLLGLSGSDLRPPVLLFRLLPRFRRLFRPRDARVFESGDGRRAENSNSTRSRGRRKRRRQEDPAQRAT